MFLTPLPLENQYNSVITAKEVCEGISKTLANAKELLRDAKILLDNSSFSRSIALSILAIEEYGKIDKIKELLLTKDKVASVWRELRSHKAKNYIWQFPIFKSMGIDDHTLIEQYVDPKSDSVAFLDQLKQVCLYTEAIKKEDGKGCLWWLPSEITDMQLAKVYFEIAEHVVLDDGIEWSEGALKIFAEHNSRVSGKVYPKDPFLYYTALNDAGFITTDRCEKIMDNITRSKELAKARCKW